MATATKMVTDLVTTTLSSASSTSTLRAASQGGIIEGSDPAHYDPSHPLILFIIQAGIIIILSRALHYPLTLLRQPRVIAEVIGGVLLGPSVLGRIPNFTSTIFPAESIPNLNLIANLGLVLFLFLVGLEVDLRFLASNWRPALSVGAAGMAVPFGLGCAISWGLYHEFRLEEGMAPVAFGTYTLFIGVAMAITAFPVLCRILTELKLLRTPVGIIVLSAGVGNDVVGWILLALCVALVNAGSGLTALYVLLTCLAFALFLVFAIRPVFLRILHRSNALTDGPSQGIIVLTLLIALGCAFFTGVIGVHPIFGAFMAGLMCPHESGFAIKVTEKIEDVVSALFLPLYFALSGLSTNLGLLDDAITWAYVFGVIAIAFFAKFAGGAVAARLNGMVWREAFAIGALMSCKGLVELIVLNIGLQAKILSTRTFTIFVVMALVTTFATTPLTAKLYPPGYQRKLEAWKRGEIDWETDKPIDGNEGEADAVVPRPEDRKVKNLLVCLRLDNLPTLLAFVSLLASKPGDAKKRAHPSLEKTEKEQEEAPTLGGLQRMKPLQVHGVRLLELTERGSAVMKVSEVEEAAAFDPVLNAFRVLSQLYNIAVSGEVVIAPTHSFCDVLTNRAADEPTDLLLLPWSETGRMTEAISTSSATEEPASEAYANFVASTMADATCDVAVFVNKGFSGTLTRRVPAANRSMSAISLRRTNSELQTPPQADRSHHIFMPFLGGADDRAALRLVLQLLENPEITATIVHLTPDRRRNSTGSAIIEEHRNPAKTAGQSSEAEDSDKAFFTSMQKSITGGMAERVLLESCSVTSISDAVLQRTQAEVSLNPKNGGDLVVLGCRYGVETSSSGGRTSGCLGSVAEKLLSAGVGASVLVLQAGSKER